MKTRIDGINLSYTSRGLRRYSIELWHDGLHKHREIKGSDESIVRRKAHLQIVEWDKKWEIENQRTADRSARDRQREYNAQQKQVAEERTAEARAEIAELESLLAFTLDVDDTVNWNSLKDWEPFPEPKPLKLSDPPFPLEPQISAEPQITDSKFAPELGILDRILSGRKQQRIQEAKERFEKARSSWKERRDNADLMHSSSVQRHKDIVNKLNKDHEDAIKGWEKRQAEYLEKRKKNNAAIDSRMEEYMSGNGDAISEYCDMVLSGSSYPDCFPAEWELFYDVSSKSLIVEYALPSPENIPNLKEVKYIQTRGEIVESYLTENQTARLYDSIIYQVALRTMHELYEADKIKALQSIVFNGRVTAVNRSTGTTETSCILSVQAMREEFLQINLAAVDPKACFKMLRGIGSSKLHSLTPIAPVVEMRREETIDLWTLVL